MRKRKNIIKYLKSFGLLIFLLIVFCGFRNSVYSKEGSPNKTNCISSNDSIVFNILEILQEEKNLGKIRRYEIEKKINTFPGKVLRRDTSTYYLQTVLGIAYNEYVTENFGEAKSTASNFSNNVVEQNPFTIPIKYGLIKFTSFRVKDKEDSVISDKILNFEISPELKRREVISKFIVDFLPDIPLDLNLETYRRLLKVFKEAGGSPEMISKGLVNNFFELCEKANREDILNYADDLWEMDGDILEINHKKSETDYSNLEPPKGFEEDIHSPDSIKLDNLRKLREFALQIYDVEGNIETIDSLILIGKPDSIGKYMDNFQNLKLARGENRDIIEKAIKYEKYISSIWQPRFYGFWGIAHLALGEYEEAKDKFAKSFDEKEKKETFSGTVLNYATALGQNGDIESAIELFKTQEGRYKTIPEAFAFWDGLGYLYSFKDSKKSLECYEKADSVVLMNDGPNFNSNWFLSWPSNNGTRHYCRKCRVLQNDLFQWRNALQQARLTSGVDSYFSFYGGIPAGLYHSEMGRFKNLLFDFEGAQEEFERAREIFESLDPEDYRIKWWYECWQDLRNFNETYCKSKESIFKTLDSGEFSSLHNIWLLGNLASHYGEDEGHDFDISFINESLAKNLTETIYALSNYESRNIPVSVCRIQELLMNDNNLHKETENLLELNLLRKGVMGSSKAGIEKHLIETKGQIKQDYSLLSQLRKELNSAYAYEDSLKIRKLLPQIANKESRLYYAIKDSIKIDDFLSSDIRTIRNNLNNNDIAIDFIEFQSEGKIKSGAFIIFPNKDIRYVDITPYIKEIETGDDFTKIWLPLLSFMEGRENIYFSPDGRIINRGIEYYLNEDGEPLYQNYKLHRVSHLRNIGSKAEPINGEIAVIGVSDHNSPVGEGETLYRGNWSDLPDVELEVRLLDNILQNYPHKLYFNDTAIEENIKELDGSNVSIMHFSTHGVYRGVDSLISAASDPDNFDSKMAQRTLKGDRQEISGIVLRKGNLTWQMPHLLDDEDDILTAEEIEVMNFPNLQLTVLSACDSGLGEINNDGIQGLQRSFRIAGSKNIICSLNKVDDYWSAQFMGELYNNLTEGQSIYDSFRNAQISIKLAAPDNPAAWSSYILIE